jgi:hypothetical protein
MTEPNLGSLIEGDAERDAVHVALIPMIAGEHLSAGEKFCLKFDDRSVALRGDYRNPEEVVGVVDPFLPGFGGVEKGEKFWGMLFPQTVTGMRHHWQHPLFDKPAEEIVAETNYYELWLRNFCDEWNFDFDELIGAATGTSEWRFVVARGKDLHSAGELGEDHALFWEHLEGYMDVKFSEDHRDGMGWSCSC